MAPRMYESLIEVMESNDSDMAACSFTNVYQDRMIPESDSRKVKYFSRKEALEQLYLQREIRFEVWNKVFRRETIGSIRFKPGQVYEDVYFARKYFSRINSVAYIDKPFYYYLQSVRNTNSHFNPRRLYKELIILSVYYG